jgi:polyhydroxyalkanoate synthesis repressor PhaR
MNEGMKMEGPNTNLGINNQNNTNLGATSNAGANALSASAGAAAEQNKFVKTIKRYQNRKLYDTHQSCYVTLDEIAEMIMRGEEVVVIDNRSKKDITSSTLTQIIFEKQKRSKAIIPVDTLRDIIQVGGGTFSGFLSKTAESGSNVLSKAKADLNRAYGAAENLRGTFQVTQRAADDLKKAIDQRAASNGGTGGKEALAAAQAQLKNLSTQLGNIEKLIEAVELRSGNA